jgi:Na+/glutamate symporter
MSKRNGFTSGFVLGSIIGGIVGGVIGALVVSGRNQEPEETDTDELLTEGEEVQLLNPKKRDKMETARRSLENKIAQLNSAIDEVRLSVGKE